MAALTPDQRELGGTVLDIGAATTGVAVFSNGRVIFTDTVPLGAGHVTKDIARGLTTPPTVAERLKTLHGSCIIAPADDAEVLAVPLIGEDDENAVNHLPRSMLNTIIKPRMEEIFELVRDKLAAFERDGGAARTVVLTGGGSQLGGIGELAAHMFERPATLGRPHGVAGLAEAVSGPAFSVASGLLLSAGNGTADPLVDALAGIGRKGGPFGRLGAWLKENF